MQTLTSIFQILVWISRMKWDGMLGNNNKDKDIDDNKNDN